MTILMSILGILLIILGIFCAITPAATFMATGYVIAIILIVSGIAGIINAFYFRFYGWNLVVSILAAVLGVLAITRPGGTEIIDGLLIYLIGLWFILRGCVSVYLAFKVRKLPVNSDWWMPLVVGILGILIGIYSLVHPMVPSIAIGLLIALYLIEQGMDIITVSWIARRFE